MRKSQVVIPREFEPVRQAALRVLQPVIPASDTTQAPADFWLRAGRTDGGRRLPEYYLVYFVLVDLLGFPFGGQHEKVAWSVPIDYQGEAYVVEHRKFGLGIFVPNSEAHEAQARAIAICITKAVKAAKPFLEWMADQAMAESKVNVRNVSSVLFGRYKYLRDCHDAKAQEAEARKEERITTRNESPEGGLSIYSVWPACTLFREAQWLALSVIEAFFAWTEHVLIHVAILLGRVGSAGDVAQIAKAQWEDKYRAVFDLTDTQSKQLFDEIMTVRKELRNHVAHGAFGKQGEAFLFHSGAGAVPVLMPHREGTRHFRFGEGIEFDASKALQALDRFIAHLWDGPRAPAGVYLNQVDDLATVLTLATDGTYATAMKSKDSMAEFLESWIHAMDRSANMDW